ncbi:MAG: hypothetical protein KDE34_02535, partial [Anaerolineales bacterium]|nr:hypothetical protein [Anaerolineales bacterium]
PWTAAHDKRQHHRPRPGQPNYQTTYRVKQNVTAISLLALDVETGDDLSTLDYWLQRDPFASQYAGLVHTTASHRPEAPRCRVIFQLDQPLTIDQAELARKAIIDRWPFIDHAPAVNSIYYGAAGCEFVRRDVVLPVDVLQQEIIEPYQRKQKPISEPSTLPAPADLANADVVTSYVSRVLAGVLADVAGSQAGTHDKLRGAAVRLASIELAEWLSADARTIITGWQERLFAAARESGYVAKYGEAETWRVISSGPDHASPANYPNWRTLPPKHKTSAPPEPLPGMYDHIPADLVINVPAGKYLADCDFDLPERTILYANTGLGKTTYAAGLPGQTVIVTSTNPAVQQLAERYGAARFDHIERSATPDSQLIATTYESLPKLRQITGFEAHRYNLVIDELHNFAASGSKAFRGEPLEQVADLLNGRWRRVLVMTGTPVPLSHPYFQTYKIVTANQQPRRQLAQLVIYKSDDNPKGRRRDAVLARCNPAQSHLIFLNNKRGELDRTIAGLETKGFKPGEILTLNSGNKQEALQQEIIRSERLPAGIRVLIVTSVFVEAVNLRTAFDCVHLVSYLPPVLAQQLVNRIRGKGPGVVYVYSSAAGTESKVNLGHFTSRARSQAWQIVRQLRDLAITDPKGTSQAAIMARSDIRRWGAAGKDIIRINDSDPEADPYWDVSYIGVDYEAFRMASEFYRANPPAYQEALRPYGWQWKEAATNGGPDLDPAAAERADQLAAQLIDIRQANHAERVEAIRDMGEKGARHAKQHSEVSGDKLDTLTQIIALTDTLRGDDTSDVVRVQAFSLACDQAKEAAGSAQKVQRLIRQIHTQRNRKQSPITRQIYIEFAGETVRGAALTPAAIFARLRHLYSRDPVMGAFARTLTQKKAVMYFRELFATKRAKLAGPEGERLNGWQIISDQPLPPAVADFVSQLAEKPINTVSCETTTALATPPPTNPAGPAKHLAERQTEADACFEAVFS